MRCVLSIVSSALDPETLSRTHGACAESTNRSMCTIIRALLEEYTIKRGGKDEGAVRQYSRPSRFSASHAASLRAASLSLGFGYVLSACTACMHRKIVEDDRK
jgi:hypothetical protein